MRVSSGVRGFDELIDGGFPEGRLYIVSGPPGSGKTTFTTQFLSSGVREDQTCVFLSMHETKRELIQDMSRYQSQFADYLDTGRVKFLNIFTQEGKRILSQTRPGNGPVSAENIKNRIVRIADSKGVDRVVIDSMMILDHVFKDGDEASIDFLTSLKQVDATVILISEMTDPSSYTKEQYLAHGVIFLHNYLDSSGMTRGIQTVKMRGTNIDCDIRRVDFGEYGLQVHPDQIIQ